ncbi:hypothetical protein KFL_000030690 [Klebsormidium nitens]|uniref:Uncharacterized protein n=1 Tax=Klebsormidium nitens TaxID=105231 RepID=A0A1Y1HJR3_KLENI|nr:hypothetical protein KFL_000030690 [Klebsormidium nitens]|eukprot:GAQ77792.1 hypothetical protein KFL_000030690 [Klebsormidium nitens]
MLTQELRQAVYQSGGDPLPRWDVFNTIARRAPVCAACRRRDSFAVLATQKRHQNLASCSPLPKGPDPRFPSVRASTSNAEAITPASKPVLRRARLRPPKSTAVDRGATTGAPGSVEIRVSRGVEDGTGYDSDVEVGDAQLPAEQPWGGVHPAVQFVAEFLRVELPKFFAEEGLSTAVYAKDVHFRDPLISIRGVRLFELNVFFLRLLFAGGQFILHDIAAAGRDEVVARWTFALPARFLPWRPVVFFTGVSKFGVDLQQAKLTSHYDYWDNLGGKQNEPPSFAAIASIASQIQPLTAFNRPLDRPYLLLRRARDYDVRQYEIADNSECARTIAVRRGNADLIRALEDDRIRVERTECSVRMVRTSWPHKELREVYVPVAYVPVVEEIDKGANT